MKKVLYFVNGLTPSSDEFAKAMQIDGKVEFRNAFTATELEQCDAVAGAVPKQYADKFPKAAVKKFKENPAFDVKPVAPIVAPDNVGINSEFE